MGNGLDLVWAIGWSWQHVGTVGKGSVETSHIAVRILAYAHVSFPAVPCRGVAIWQQFGS